MARGRGKRTRLGNGHVGLVGRLLRTHELAEAGGTKGGGVYHFHLFLGLRGPLPWGGWGDTDSFLVLTTVTVPPFSRANKPLDIAESGAGSGREADRRAADRPQICVTNTPTTLGGTPNHAQAVCPASPRQWIWLRKSKRRGAGSEKTRCYPPTTGIRLGSKSEA